MSTGRCGAVRRGAVRHPAVRPGAGQQGAGSLLVLGVLASVVLVTVLTVPLLGLLVVAQGVQNAADAAALAAADTASGAVSGFPCAAGERAAALNGASVTDCRVEGLVATVTVQREYVGFMLSARARAGPPPARRLADG